MPRQHHFVPTVLVFGFMLSIAQIGDTTSSTGESAAAEAADVGAGPSPDYAYRNYTVIRDLMYATETEFPGIAKVYDIGDSWEKTQGLADRDVLAMKISDNVESDEDEPEILIMALHHAREWPTSEIASQLIDNLTALYGLDARISWLVDNRETWIIPVVNPDGLDYAMADPANDDWRKNRRDNGDGTYGVDLNRNYNGSQNDDPLGEWGGAGTSSDTSDSTYCGEYPFSEPETQAIRDLALNHSFTVGIDLHTFGDQVMWPWGYTTNTTSDDVDLVRIGNELAELNGYVADQSVALYPTTGDSLDWLYGGMDVFTFLFEVGGNADWFHPEEEDVVLSQIAENIPPALLLIEIAGDRHERQFDIVHQPLPEESPPGEDLAVEAEITAARGVDTASLAVQYRVDGSSWSEALMSRTLGNDTYAAAIPAQAAGASVEYFILAHDNGSVRLTSPRYAPYELHSFSVLVDEEPPVANAGENLIAQVGSAVTFVGSASTDNVAITNFTWSFDYESSPMELYGESPSFTFWSEGEYLVTLVVRDSAGNSDTDTVMVTVNAEVIPEFQHAAVPIIFLLAVFIFAYRRRRTA